MNPFTFAFKSRYIVGILEVQWSLSINDTLNKGHLSRRKLSAVPTT